MNMIYELLLAVRQGTTPVGVLTDALEELGEYELVKHIKENNCLVVDRDCLESMDLVIDSCNFTEEWRKYV